MFIYVYRLAIDARPKWGDGVAGRKYPSLLEDFQTVAASMARKRHLASTPRGLLCFCLIPPQPSVLSVQSVVEKKSRVKPYVLLLSNSPAKTDFPVEPRILDCSTKKNREKFAE